MTTEEIFYQMKRHGFKRNSRNWQDYSKAKNDLLWDKNLTPNDYNHAVTWIAEYLGL